MSKSLKRVKQVLVDHQIQTDILEMPGETRTAQQAALAADCDVDQIAKSIVFQGKDSGKIFLFVTPGGKSVDLAKATALAGEPLVRADAKAVRSLTGFAIGGVAPIGHTTSIPVFMDPLLTEFPIVWAAGGTPRHIFSIPPAELARISSSQLTVFT